MKTHRLQPGDAKKMQELSSLFNRVFEMEFSEPASENYCEQILINENSIYLVAEENGAIVGGLSSFIMPFVHGNSEIFVYDLAVEENLQRKGIGTQLMQKLKEISIELGADGIIVPAENEDEHAIKFYNKTGGEGNDEVTLFWYPTKTK